MKPLLLSIFMVFSFFSFSQYRKDSTNTLIKNGIMTSIGSILPFYVSIKTFESNLPLPQRRIYGSVWFTFGIVLNVSSISDFVKAHKYKKSFINE